MLASSSVTYALKPVGMLALAQNLAGKHQTVSTRGSGVTTSVTIVGRNVRHIYR